MIDTQELRDRTLEAVANAIHEAARPSLAWAEAMDAARAVMEVPAIDTMLRGAASYARIMESVVERPNTAIVVNDPEAVRDFVAKLEGVTA